MLGMAFFQCYRTTKNLDWAADSDFDRDISFVQGSLSGHYGHDPSYKGEWLWYNPLLFSVETVISKWTSLPAHVVATRAGVFLNVLGGIFFLITVSELFGLEIGLGALLCFLFLVSGNIPGWGAATLSPWLYPVCFSQFLFYTNILLCYLAFSTERLGWFACLGLSLGISFLSHTAPTILIILILITVQLPRIWKAAFNDRGADRVKLYLVQGLSCFLFFVLAAMPLLYYLVGKYHLHMVNRATFEYTEGIFIVSHFKAMLKANFSVALVVAALGLIWFHLNSEKGLIRKIIYGWLGWTLLMYFYSTAVSVFDNKWHIHLPGTVPSFHYFFYLKALESVFFGMGIYGIFNWVWINLFRRKLRSYNNYRLIAYSLVVLACAGLYFPVYSKRADFTMMRDQALAKAGQLNKMEVYNFLMNHSLEEDVVLCDKDPSLFPVMTTGRKMVSTAFTFSNPFVDFDRRENDRDSMLNYARSGTPVAASGLFGFYGVKLVLLENNDAGKPFIESNLCKKLVFRNKSYSIYQWSN